ncbi:MAG TPA: hypothetical protein VIY50_08030 [Steroidobacteraceae bacterium]
MALLLLGVIVGGVFLFHRLGLWQHFSLSWDLAWRIFLNILLVLGVLGLISKVWSIAVVLGHFNAALLISPSRDPGIDIASTAVLALALYGVWRRWKWGAYLIFVRLAFTIGVQVLVYHSYGWHLVRNYSGAENLYGDLSGAVMWLLAFNRNWAYFG